MRQDLELLVVAIDNQNLTCSAEDKTADGGIFAADFKDWEHASPTLSYSEAAFGEALLDMYVGSGKLVPDARQKWAKAAQSFLPSNSEQ